MQVTVTRAVEASPYLSCGLTIKHLDDNRVDRAIPKKSPLSGAFSKRMNGLEPSTFCMARTRREVTGGDWSRHLALLSGFLAVQRDTGGQQLTEKANPAANPSPAPRSREPRGRANRSGWQ